MIDNEDAWNDFWGLVAEAGACDYVAVEDAHRMPWVVWVNEDGDAFARGVCEEGDGPSVGDTIEDAGDLLDATGVRPVSALAYPLTLLSRAVLTPQTAPSADTVEAVAQAICASDREMWDDIDEVMRDQYREIARAALSAVTPTAEVNEEALEDVIRGAMESRSGNAVTPPAARDLIATVASAITGEEVAA